jgi:cell shape-determining protein MreD
MLNSADPTFLQKYRVPFWVFCMSAGLTFLSVLPVWGWLGFCPNFFLIIFYLWMLYRPDLMTHRQVVMQALLKDILFMAPLGTHLILSLLIYALIFGVKRWLVSQPFMTIYGFFIVLCGLDQYSYWGLQRIFLPVPFPVKHFLLSLTVTGLIYPLFSLLSLRWQQKLEA